MAVVVHSAEGPCISWLCCVQDAKKKLHDDIESHMAAHTNQVKAAKPRINREELAKLGAQFVARQQQQPAQSPQVCTSCTCSLATSSRALRNASICTMGTVATSTNGAQLLILRSQLFTLMFGTYCGMLLLMVPGPAGYDTCMDRLHAIMLSPSKLTFV